LADAIANGDAVVRGEPDASAAQAIVHHPGQIIEPLRMTLQERFVLQLADLEDERRVHRSYRRRTSRHNVRVGDGDGQGNATM